MRAKHPALNNSNPQILHRSFIKCLSFKTSATRPLSNVAAHCVCFRSRFYMTFHFFPLSFLAPEQLSLADKQIIEVGVIHPVVIDNPRELYRRLSKAEVSQGTRMSRRWAIGLNYIFRKMIKKLRPC